MKTVSKPDNRPRFGWVRFFDHDPILVHEKRVSDFERYAVVIPLPYASASLLKNVRAFTKELHPTQS